MSDIRSAYPSAAIDIVHRFWDQVWNAHNPDAVDHLVTEDFVITSGGVPTEGRAAFKRWVADFLAAVDDIRVEVVESFQNADGSRVASRWVITGRNNGFAGTEPDGQPIELTGIAVLAIRPDGLLEHNWVERSSLEQFRRLTTIN